MAGQEDVKEVDKQSGKVKKARRFDDRDWKAVIEYVVSEWERRKEKRKDRERYWDDVDRQIRMEPEVAWKKLSDGNIDINKAWMAETELPLQATALEVLSADARRMLFAENAPWFKAHAEVTDEYLEKVEAEGGIHVLGDKNFVPSFVNQDNADKLVAGYLNHFFRQYDHHSRFDRINAEVFKYGMGVARTRIETKGLWIHEARGIRTEKQRIPVIVPCSIRQTYLEEEKPSLHSATVLGPSVIMEDNLKYASIAIAASKGSIDPEDPDGGWMPKNLGKLLPGKNGYVKVLEMEGDIVFPRKSVKSIVIPGGIVTIAVGGPDGAGVTSKAVLRFRFRKQPYSSYLLFPYMHEGADEAYASSPLMKGRTLQIAATDALNRFFDSGMLKLAPPIGYDGNDPQFALSGGPNVEPYAKWRSLDGVKVHSEVGGDPGSLAQAALQLINLYAELTGVLPARLGKQTKSHTTARSNQNEIERGAVRTVDYVNATGHGPVTQWLHQAYDMALECAPKGRFSLWIPEYAGYVELDKAMLPKRASFDWFGANGPQEKLQKAQMRFQSLEAAVKLDQLQMQMGKPGKIDIGKAIDQILREGGWDDPGAIEVQQQLAGPPGQATPGAGVPGAPGSNPGAAIAALQNLQGGGPE